MPAAVCPSCQRKVSLPDNYSGRTVQTMCPKCGELLPVPPAASRHHQEETAAQITAGSGTATVSARELRRELAEATASSKNLGLLVLTLGLAALLSVAVSFCLTFVQYLGLALSGVGLLLGLYGMIRGTLRRERDTLYVMAGVGVSALATGLLLTRLLFPPSAGQPTGTNRDSPNLYQQEQKELGP
jgi:predicted RNA-binding Zn-ribbon protein involved in translation (DUF1610 family)